MNRALIDSYSVLTDVTQSLEMLVDRKKSSTRLLNS